MKKTVNTSPCQSRTEFLWFRHGLTHLWALTVIRVMQPPHGTLGRWIVNPFTNMLFSFFKPSVVVCTASARLKLACLPIAVSFKAFNCVGSLL